MNKTLVAIIVLAVVVILGFWLFGSSTEVPTETTAEEADATANIAKELDSVNVDDLDKEFQDINTELNNL